MKLDIQIPVFGRKGSLEILRMLVFNNNILFICLHDRLLIYVDFSARLRLRTTEELVFVQPPFVKGGVLFWSQYPCDEPAQLHVTVIVYIMLY